MRARPSASIAAALGIILSASALAPVSEASTAAEPTYADYVNETQTIYDPATGEYIAIEAVGSSECDKATSARTGAWICFEDATYGTDPVDPTVVTDSQGTDAVAAASTGVCVTGGCWTRESNIESTHKGNGWYGYGKTQLGKVEFHFRVRISGYATTSSNVWFRSTRGVKGLVFTGDRLYLSSKYPEGKPVNGGAAYKNYIWGPLSANTTATWIGNYGSYENTVQYASIVHQYSWNDTSSKYPGQWWFYAKSLRMVKGTNGYTFPDLTRPQKPRESGWKP